MCDFFGKIIITWETIVKHDHHCMCIVISLHLIESYTYTSYIYNNIHVHSYGYMCCIMGDIFITLKKLLSKEKRHGETKKITTNITVKAGQEYPPLPRFY